MSKQIKHQIKAVTTAMSRTNELYGYWAKKEGLNYNSLAILDAINTSEICTQKKICDEWLIPKQTVNTICKELLENRYIYFEENSADKRSKIIKLTTDGQNYVDGLLGGLYQIEEKVMEKMGKEMCEWFVKCTETYYTLFEREVKK
ncbi:helix-turn-helix domain-containing protein [Vallitaleaceae bacterium 9-2]